MRTLRLSAKVVVVLLALALLYFGVTLLQVWRASTIDDVRSADAIVVLGAAQYDGRPSQVLQARLNHAADLYADGVAPVVVVTGGRGPGDRFTEATAAASYLHTRGVPEDALRREVSGRTSYESLAATARFLRDEDVATVVLVSDPFHAYRIGAISAEVGLDATVSPTRTSPIRGGAVVRQLARETVAVGLGRVLGYRRMRNLEERFPTQSALEQVADLRELLNYQPLLEG